VEVGAVWNGDDDDLLGGHFAVELAKGHLPVAAAAPGLQ
jgi:hypothetical protein